MLITLVIIGIIAALTIPNLMKNYQTHVWKTAYKRAYADINNALTMLKAEEDIELSNEAYDIAYGELFKKVAQKFKASKTCFNKSNIECWEFDGEAGWPEPSAVNWKGTNKSAYAFIDQSGRAWKMYYDNEPVILYDNNGKKGPNKLGQDRMPLLFKYNEKANNWSVIYFNNDYTTPQRWCPSGECYYKSWILNQK